VIFYLQLFIAYYINNDYHKLSNKKSNSDKETVYRFSIINSNNIIQMLNIVSIVNIVQICCTIY